MKSSVNGLFTLFFFSVCFCFSCHHQPAVKTVSPAFYYWRHDFQLDSVEKNYLAGTGKSVLYIRFFDVVWDASIAQPVPRAPIRFVEKPDSSLAYVPVVFITNETLGHCTKEQIHNLAKKILQKIKRISASLPEGYEQVQIDCDWTGSTKKKYFSMLVLVHQRLQAEHILLSVTLRLHQIKYAKRTGIPPADRCMLMFYNMGDWKLPQTKNSIYDLEIADRYIARLNKYPMPLDIALPLLRWTIVYRNGRFLTFLNYITSTQLKRCDFLKKSSGENRFIVPKDTFAFGCSLRKNDLLRSESCNFDDLIKGEKQLLSHIHQDSLSVALFHLDDQLLKYYSHAQIKKIFSPVQ